MASSSGRGRRGTLIRNIGRAAWVVILIMVLSMVSIVFFILRHTEVNEGRSEVTDDTPLGNEPGCAVIQWKTSSLSSGAAASGEGQMSMGEEHQAAVESQQHHTTARFDREAVDQCEGYWRRLKKPKGGKIHSDSDLLPFPEEQPQVFCGQTEWLRRLEVIEKIAEITADRTGAAGGRGGGNSNNPLADIGRGHGLTMARFRGLTNSRLDGSFLGNKEYYDTVGVEQDGGGPSRSSAKSYSKHKVVAGDDENSEVSVHEPKLKEGGKGEGEGVKHSSQKRLPHQKFQGGGKMCWTGDFGSHYVREFNVRPSRQFYKYVIQKYSDLKESGIEDE